MNARQAYAGATHIQTRVQVKNRGAECSLRGCLQQTSVYGPNIKLKMGNCAVSDVAFARGISESSAQDIMYHLLTVKLLARVSFRRISSAEH